MPDNHEHLQASDSNEEPEEQSLRTPRAVFIDTDDYGDRTADEIVDEWGRQSFPASDPPSNW